MVSRKSNQDGEPGTIQFTSSLNNLTSEHLPGAPILPDCVHWSDDCKLAFVTDENIMITTYLSKELSRFLRNPPYLTRYFLSLPKKSIDGMIPHEDEIEIGKMTYEILHEKERKQSSNPREISLAKGDIGMTFIGAIWGPQGSAPNHACAIVTLTSNGQIIMYFPSTLELNWKQGIVISDVLRKYVQRNKWTPSRDTSLALFMTIQLPSYSTQKIGSRKKSETKRQRTSETSEYVHENDLISVTSIAWSIEMTDETISYSFLALCGRAITTIWKYVHGSSSLSDEPHAVVETGAYGWPTCCQWMYQDTTHLAIGTSSGNVLQLELHDKLTIKQIFQVPQLNPVYSIQYKSQQLIVAAGKRISVWDVRQDTNPAISWLAHDSNITCLKTNHSDNTLLSSSSDGNVKCWDITTGDDISYEYLPKKTYPIYGLSVSPNGIQIAVGYLCPPAAKPSRITQADTNYARLSSGLECFTTPEARNPLKLVAKVENNLNLTSLGDILSYCHAQNSMYCKKRADMQAFHVEDTEEPLYLEMCKILQEKYNAVHTNAKWNSPIYLQVAYQISINMEPNENHESTIMNLRQRIMCYVAENTLSQSKNVQHAKKSLLVMADYLWLCSMSSPEQCSMTQLSLQLVMDVYKSHGTDGDLNRLKSMTGELEPRETCSLCSSVIPLTENLMEPICINGHGQERCMNSFLVIQSDEQHVWKCNVCEAYGIKDDNEFRSCKLCGGYCQIVEI